MVALGFRHAADPIDEVERGLEVGKCEDSGQVMLLDHAPLRHLFLEPGKFLTGEGWHPSPAGRAVFGSQLHTHTITVGAGRGDGPDSAALGEFEPRLAE